MYFKYQSDTKRETRVHIRDDIRAKMGKLKDFVEFSRSRVEQSEEKKRKGKEKRRRGERRKD